MASQINAYAKYDKLVELQRSAEAVFGSEPKVIKRPEHATATTGNRLASASTAPTSALRGTFDTSRSAREPIPSNRQRINGLSDILGKEDLEEARVKPRVATEYAYYSPTTDAAFDLDHKVTSVLKSGPGDQQSNFHQGPKSQYSDSGFFGEDDYSSGPYVREIYPDDKMSISLQAVPKPGRQIYQSPSIAIEMQSWFGSSWLSKQALHSGNFVRV